MVGVLLLHLHRNRCKLVSPESALYVLEHCLLRLNHCKLAILVGEGDVLVEVGNFCSGLDSALSIPGGLGDMLGPFGFEAGVRA